MTSQSGGGGVPSGAAGGDLTGSYPSPTLIASRTPALVQLGKVIVGAATATIAFSSISQAYTSLVLDLDGRGDTAALLISANIQFNGDTAANYDTAYMDQNGATLTGVTSYANTSFNNSIIFPAATAVANTSGTGHLLLPNYAGTVFHKNIQVYTEWKQDNTTVFRTRASSGTWRSAVAITSILVTASAGNFITGTTAVLYGVV